MGVFRLCSLGFCWQHQALALLGAGGRCQNAALDGAELGQGWEQGSARRPLAEGTHSVGCTPGCHRQPCGQLVHPHGAEGGRGEAGEARGCSGPLGLSRVCGSTTNTLLSQTRPLRSVAAGCECHQQQQCLCVRHPEDSEMLGVFTSPGAYSPTQCCLGSGVTPL